MTFQSHFHQIFLANVSSSRPTEQPHCQRHMFTLHNLTIVIHLVFHLIERSRNAKEKGESVTIDIVTYFHLFSCVIACFFVREGLSVGPLRLLNDLADRHYVATDDASSYPLGLVSISYTHIHHYSQMQTNLVTHLTIFADSCLYNKICKVVKVCPISTDSLIYMIPVYPFSFLVPALIPMYSIETKFSMSLLLKVLVPS